MLKVELGGGQQPREEQYVVTSRLGVAEDGSVLPEEDPRVVRVWATPGDRIPMSVARDKGLVDEKPKAKPVTKKRTPSENK